MPLELALAADYVSALIHLKSNTWDGMFIHALEHWVHPTLSPCTLLSLHHVFYNSQSPHYKNTLNDYMPPHHGESVRLQLCCQNTDTERNASLHHWQKDTQASFSLSFCLILRDRHALTTSSGPFKDMSNKSARLWDAVSHLRLLPNPLSDIRALMKCINLLFFTSWSLWVCDLVITGPVNVGLCSWPCMSV